MIRTKKIPTALSAFEEEALARIRVIREAAFKNQPSHLQSADHVGIMRDLILAFHGNTQLRLYVLAEELGTTMRVLERKFKLRYGVAMSAFSEETRIDFAERILQRSPSSRIAEIALALGYHRSSEFTRFFKARSKSGLTPSRFRSLWKTDAE